MLRSSLTNSAPTSRSISRPGVAGADVVERELEALRPQAAQALEDRRRPAAEALGDLHHDAAGVEARVGDGAQQPVVVGVEVERLRRDVEEQQRVRRQVRRRAQRAAHAEGVEVADAADLLGDVERLRGVREPGLGPRPRERLDAEQRARAEVPDRLERGGDVLGGEEAVQRADLLGRGDGDAVADVGEVDDRRAAVALGLVERGVGLGQQRLRLVARPQRARADAGRDAGAAQGGVEAPGDGAGAVRAGAREDHRELVAADAVGAVAGAELAEDPGRAAQERVAVRMAVTVVEELEVVEVDGADAEPVVVARGGVHLAGEVLAEGALVGQVGQPVAARTAQRDAVAAHERAAADEVEDERGAEHADDDEQHRRPADVAELAVEELVVAGDLEGVTAVGEPHRHDELEVAPVRARVGLVADVRASVPQGGVDLRVRVAVADAVGSPDGLDDVVADRRGSPRSRRGAARSRRAARRSGGGRRRSRARGARASAKLCASARCSPAYVAIRRRWSWSPTVT